MSEHPFDDLERLGAAAVPPVDASFADRLESDLRVRHAAHERARIVPPRWRRAAYGLAAAGLVVAGLVGYDRLRVDDGDVPIEVTGPVADRSDVAAEPPAVGAEESSDGEEAGAGGREVATGAEALATTVVEPTPTPTTVPESGEAASSGAPTAVVTVAPTTGPTPATGDDPAVEVPPTGTTPPPVTATPAPPSRPSPEPTPTPARPSAPPPPNPTPRPVPTETPTPRPTATPTAVELNAACAVRAERDTVGVVCEWQAPVGVDIARYAVHRIRNGGPREVVATVRPPRTQVVDRQVRPGDSIVYVVTGLAGDSVRAVSERVVVRVPAG